MFRLWRTHRATVAAQQIYERVLVREGPTALGVRWNSAQGQTHRFELLLRVVDRTDTDALHIQDLGCGVGALFEHLAHQPYMRQGRYTGIDRSSAMIMVAKGRVQDARARFIQSDRVTEIGDYTLISGTYNVKMSAPWEDWWFHVQQSIQRAWSHSRRGLAFNLLNAAKPPTSENFFAVDAERVLRFCRTQLSESARLQSSDQIEDITVCVSR